MTVVADARRGAAAGTPGHPRAPPGVGWPSVVDVGVVSVTGGRRMDLRRVGKEGACSHRTNHAGITASGRGLNVSRDRKLDTDGNTDLSEACRTTRAYSRFPRRGTCRELFLPRPISPEYLRPEDIDTHMP